MILNVFDGNLGLPSMDIKSLQMMVSQYVILNEIKLVSEIQLRNFITHRVDVTCNGHDYMMDIEVKLYSFDRVKLLI